MDTRDDSIYQKLSITRQNQHQYFETQIVNAAAADREITLAEDRGRKRRLREQALKTTLIRTGWGLLAVAACAAAVVLLRFLV